MLDARKHLAIDYKRYCLEKSEAVNWCWHKLDNYVYSNFKIQQTNVIVH